VQDSLGCFQRGVTRAGRPVRFDMQLSKLSPFLESYVLVTVKYIYANSKRVTHPVEGCACVES
jgi:hypothetical protein